MAYLQSYDPKSVAVIFNGTPLVGYGPNTFIELERNAPVITNVVGIAGEIAPIKTTDQSGTIRVTLQQNSPSNGFLQNYLSEYEIFYNSSAYIPMGQLIMRDTSAKQWVIHGVNAYLVAYPVITLGASQNTQTWEFFSQFLSF